MDIGVLGINYKSSELELRESFAKACKRLIEQEKKFSSVLLSTCNRTEIYFSSNFVAQTHSDLLNALKKILGSGKEPRLYSYFKDHCFLHLAKVTSGIDSVIFGETEIQRQVKQSYEEAALRYTLSADLHYLFQKSLKIGKEIRTRFVLPKGIVSLESTVGNLTGCFFSGKPNVSILLIGYSKINRKIIRFFKNKKGISLHLITRSPNAIEEKEGIKLISRSEIGSWTSFDMVIAGSKCSEYLLDIRQMPGDCSSVRTGLIVDLGLPRNVDPLIGKNPLITLFNIEDIAKLIDRRKTISSQAQKEINLEVERLALRQAAFHDKRKEREVLCV